MIEISGYVVEASTRLIKVIVLSDAVRDHLKKLGFTQVDSSEFVLSLEDSAKRIEIFGHLRALQFAFSGGREWSPSELFELFREQGSLQGSYIRITWVNENRSNLTVC